MMRDKKNSSLTCLHDLPQHIVESFLSNDEFLFLEFEFYSKFDSINLQPISHYTGRIEVKCLTWFNWIIPRKLI